MSHKVQIIIVLVFCSLLDMTDKVQIIVLVSSILLDMSHMVQSIQL